VPKYSHSTITLRSTILHALSHTRHSTHADVDDRTTTGRRRRQVSEAQRLDLDRLKHIVPHVEFARMKRVATYLINRLEGHVSPVTDIHISKQGDRVLTGSTKVGVVCSWFNNSTIE
jgi:hypothetical protein